jgi:hypothetical protein
MESPRSVHLLGIYPWLTRLVRVWELQFVCDKRSNIGRFRSLTVAAHIGPRDLGRGDLGLVTWAW